MPPFRSFPGALPNRLSRPSTAVRHARQGRIMPHNGRSPSRVAAFAAGGPGRLIVQGAGAPPAIDSTPPVGGCVLGGAGPDPHEGAEVPDGCGHRTIDRQLLDLVEDRLALFRMALG